MMALTNFIYGPVPSRRMGQSLGVSPIPAKTCNYSCLYCQLGRTPRLINTRSSFFPPEQIIRELKTHLLQAAPHDVVTIVGEGEPSLYLDLGTLINEIKKLTPKPIAVITNGSLLWDEATAAAVSHADIVLPSLDAYDEASFRRINRPHSTLNFHQIYRGLVDFSQSYKGQLWLEIMLLKRFNDSHTALTALKRLTENITYHRLYLNTPVRPPAEEYVQAVSPEKLQEALSILGGISIESLAEGGFASNIAEAYPAILNIIGRHPMNQHEIASFVAGRPAGKTAHIEDILRRLQNDPQVEGIDYCGYTTYRLKSVNPCL